MKLKFFTLTLIATIGLICLTACGSTAPDTNENVPTETENNSEVGTAVEAEPTADVIDLTGVWRNDGGDGFYVEFYEDGTVCTYYLKETEYYYDITASSPPLLAGEGGYVFYESNDSYTDNNSDDSTYANDTYSNPYELVNLGEIILSAQKGNYEFLSENEIEIIYSQSYQFIYQELEGEVPTAENVGAFTSIEELDAWENVPKTSDTVLVRSKNTISINGKTCTKQ